MNILCACLTLLSVVTTYTNSTYHTRCEEPVSAPASVANSIVDTLVYQFQTDPERLFDWAFVGTTLQGDKDKDAFQLVWKENTYVPEENSSRLLFDVVVPGFTTFRDLTLETTLTDTFDTRGNRHARLDLHYSGNMLRVFNLTFSVLPVTHDSCTLILDGEVKFGWFFNMFISRKVYRNVIEWRLQRFLLNVRRRAEGHYDEPA